MERITLKHPTTPHTSPVEPTDSDIDILPRNQIIGLIMKKINEERKGTKWSPVTAKMIAIKVGHVKNKNDLVYLFKKCNEYKGAFSRAFFGILKVK